MPPEAAYHPISCDFYDEITVRILRQQPCEVVFTEATGTVQTLSDTLADVYTEGDAEYLRLGMGQIIRLDRLVSIDGLPLPTAC